MPSTKRPSKAKTHAEKPPVDIKADPYADAPVNKALSAEQKIDLFRQMVRIRRFEQISLKYYQEKKMGGFLHLYIGQESVAVGTISLCGKNDHVITAYRDHGHALAVGMSMNECMAELYGKITGCSKGKGGSMHFFAPDKNYWGGHGIVGGQTPLGTGLAYGLKYKGLKGCALAYMGDGAINQGAFHESLNLAGLFDLPVIYVIENNGYSMGTSQIRSSVHPPEGLAARAIAYDIAWDICEDGENLYAVRAHAAKAIERAHEQSRPTVLEIKTYRYYGHSVADANAKKYRSKEEIEKYQRDHDPILIWQAILEKEGVLTAEQAAAIQEEAKEEAMASARFADESPYPTVDDIMTDVYAEVDNGTVAGRTGTHFFNT
jgi:pyruvate dehydrogenase E1 component alpha subunit